MSYISDRNPRSGTWRAARRRQRRIRIAFVAMLCAIPLVGVTACTTWYYDDKDVTVGIVDKERAATKDGAEYRVYTPHETFVMKDSFIKTRFASADDYGKLQVGHTYKCQAFGIRIPLFSSFRNLHDCKPVT